MLASPAQECQRRRSGFFISKDILECVGKYISLYPASRGSGFPLTASLVEALYYIVPEYQHNSNFLEPQIVRNALHKAGNLLYTLSQHVGPAHRALEALRCVLLEESIPGKLSSANQIKEGFAGPNSLRWPVRRGAGNTCDQSFAQTEAFWLHDREQTAEMLTAVGGEGTSSATEQFSTFPAAPSARVHQGLDPSWASGVPSKAPAPCLNSYASSPKPFLSSGPDSRNSALSSDFLFSLDGGWEFSGNGSMEYFDLDLPALHH
jgi:hypothetical protein